MPTYEFRCPADGSWERFYTFKEFRRTDNCPQCGRAAQLIVSPPRIQKSTLQHEARFDHTLGGVVSSQQDREELLKRKSDETGRQLVFSDPQDTKSKNEEGMAEKQDRVDRGLDL